MQPAAPFVINLAAAQSHMYMSLVIPYKHDSDSEVELEEPFNAKNVNEFCLWLHAKGFLDSIVEVFLGKPKNACKPRKYYDI